MLTIKQCPVCNSNFETNSNSKYAKTVCSRKCSNTLYKRREKVHPRTFKCVNCNKEAPYVHSSYNKFCSSKCHREYEYNNITLSRFERGEIGSRPLLRKIISKSRGYKCTSCNIKEWNNKPITLQVNHIDGNCANNLPNNLELICPNCHSQTNTWGARNKGSGRKARGLPLY